MLALARNRVVWIVAVLILIAGGAGLFMSNQAKVKKAEAAKVAAAHAPKSPYVAIANGKADVEGGIIQVAARSAGVSAPVARDAAVFEMDDAVGVDLEARVMGHADHRRAELLGGALEELDHDLAVLAVQSAGGLVREEELRILGDGAGDGDALRLAAGKLGGALVHAGFEAHFH